MKLSRLKELAEANLIKPEHGFAPTAPQVLKLISALEEVKEFITNDVANIENLKWIPYSDRVKWLEKYKELFE